MTMIGVGVSPGLAALEGGEGDGEMFTPQDILERFPRLGPQKTDWWDGESSEDSPDKPILYAEQPNYLLYQGAGKSGVVRNVWGASGHLTDWGDVNDYELRIYVGAGDLTEAQRANATYLAAHAKDVTIIPLGPLLGAVYDTARAANAGICTPILEYVNGGVGSGKGMALSLHLPIPFADGILIQVWNRTGTPAVAPHIFGDYHWVSYELGSPTYPGANYRLKAASLMAHVLDLESPETVLLETAAGPGMLLGLFMSAGALDVEGNFRGYLDGETSPGWQTSGTEDLFGGMNPFGWEAGENQTPHAGVTHADGTNVEAYRIFTRDPLIWQTGLKLARENSGAVEQTISTVILYYEKAA